MARVNNWDFFNQHVQSGLMDGRYLSAAFTLVAAGPPWLAATAATAASSTATSGAAELGDIAYPIGILQGFSISSGASVMRFWEVGSERSYFMRGRTQGQASLSRLLYHGPSLLRVLYAYRNTRTDGTSDALYANSASALLNTKGTAGTKRAIKRLPGRENMWLELASDVFNDPVGLLIYFRDSNEDVVGAFYIENVMVSNHGLQLDSGNTVLSESVGLMYERIVPVDVKSVSLIRNSDDLSGVIGSNIIGSAASPA